MSNNSRAFSPQGDRSIHVTSTKSKPYKIVLESVTQAKKNLYSAVSYNVDSPSGYTFVPAGNPNLTEFCKELSRKRGLKVYIVSTAPKNNAHKNPENLSHHIHRIGHHFENHVVDHACDWLGIRGKGFVSSNGNNTLPSNSLLARRLQSQSQRLGVSQEVLTHEQRIRQVRETIRDLFPKIPDTDIDAIIKRAFEEGSERVGNAEELSLPRRVQLATVAHIRHSYTDYEARLKSNGYLNARAKVESACLDQLVRWRGEADTDTTELEEIFREVIVLDDDDSDSEARDNRERASSIEIITRPLSTGEPPILSDMDLQPSAPQYARARLVPRIEAQREMPRQAFHQRYEEARTRQRLSATQVLAQPRKQPSDRRLPSQFETIPSPGYYSPRELPQPSTPQQFGEVILLPLADRRSSQILVERPTALYVPPSTADSAIFTQSSRPIYVSEQHLAPPVHGNPLRDRAPYPDQWIDSRIAPSNPQVVYASVETPNDYASSRRPDPSTEREPKRARTGHDYTRQPDHHHYQSSTIPALSPQRQEPEFIDLTDHSPPLRPHSSNLPSTVHHKQLEPQMSSHRRPTNRDPRYMLDQPVLYERGRPEEESYSNNYSRARLVPGEAYAPVRDTVPIPVHVPLPTYNSPNTQRVHGDSRGGDYYAFEPR